MGGQQLPVFRVEERMRVVDLGSIGSCVGSPVHLAVFTAAYRGQRLIWAA